MSMPCESCPDRFGVIMAHQSFSQFMATVEADCDRVTDQINLLPPPDEEDSEGAVEARERLMRRARKLDVIASFMLEDEETVDLIACGTHLPACLKVNSLYMALEKAATAYVEAVTPN